MLDRPGVISTTWPGRTGVPGGAATTRCTVSWPSATWVASPGMRAWLVNCCTAFWSDEHTELPSDSVIT